MAFLQPTILLLVALTWLNAVEAEAGLSNSTLTRDDTTCDPSIYHLGDKDKGFDVCFFGKDENDLVSSAVAAFGNVLFVIQKILGLGKCTCNQACNPSQIACTDKGAVYKDLKKLISLYPDVASNISKFIYALEHYRVYCYCPKLIPVDHNPCPHVENPQPCDYPDRKP